MTQAREPSAGLYAAALAVLGLASLAVIWLPAYPPGVDMPTHLLFSSVIADPEKYATLMEASYAPTAQLFVWLVAAFAWAGPAIAGKLGLTLVALFFCAGFAMVAQATGLRRSAAALFGIVASHTFASAMGFANFNFASALAVIGIGVALRVWELGTAKAYAALAGWMLIVAHAHVMVAGMFGFHIFLLSAAWPGEVRGRRVVATGTALVPAAIFSAAVAWTARQGYAALNVSGGLGTQRNPIGQQLLDIGWESYGGLSRLGWLVVLATVVGVAFRIWEQRSLAAPLALASTVWLALYFVVPHHGMGWAYAQPRILIPLVIAAGAFAGWGPRPNIALAGYTASFLVYLGSYGAHSVTAGTAIASQLDSYEDVAPGRTLEAIIAPGSTDGHPGVQPLLHVAQYQYIEGGTSPLLPPYSPMIHSVRRLELSTNPPEHLPMFIHRAFDCSFNPECEVARRDVGRRVGVQGLRFDTVTFVGADESWGEEMVAYGYERLAPAIYRPRPGGVEVTFVEPPHPDADFLIRAGWPDDFGWTLGGGRPPSLGSSAPETITLGPLPGGPVFVEIATRHPNGTEVPITRAEVMIVPGEVVQLRLAP